MHLTDNLQITVKDFYTVAKKIKESEPDIQHWTFGGYVTQTKLAICIPQTTRITA